MFKVYVIPVLEFGCPIFNPYYGKDIECIEKVQRDFTRVVYKRSPLYRLNSETCPSYTERLTIFKLETLESRRLKICLNLFHQYLHGLVPLSTNSFQISSSRTRGDSHKITPQFASKDVRFNSFFIRYARIYSQLPSAVRNSSPISFPTLLEHTVLTPYLSKTEG